LPTAVFRRAVSYYSFLAVDEIYKDIDSHFPPMYAGELKRSCELVLSHIDEERRMYQQQRVKREQQQRRKKNIELEG